MTREILVGAEEKMQKAVVALRRELSTVRTGRASTGLVEHVRADYHGVPTPLGHLATITVPEARLLVIQPWDRQSIGAIEKAILRSDLGLNPSSDGTAIRLVIPPLNEERRRELGRLVRKKVEESKVELRNVRREAIEELRAMEKRKEIPEDDEKRAVEQLQKLTESFTAEADEIGRAKEAELLEI